MDIQNYVERIPYLQDLFQAAFGKSIPAEFFRWRFTENIFRTVLAHVSGRDDKIVAHYASTPLQCLVNSQPTDVALTGTVMTHPDYQGQGIFQELACAHDTELAAAQYRFLITFPNPHRPTDRFFIYKRGWSPVYEIPTLSLNPATVKNRRTFSAGYVSFDDTFDKYNYDDHIERWGLITNVRSTRYLQWRYTRHPINRYQNMVVGNGKELLAYAVFKVHVIDQQKYLDLVDFYLVDATAFILLLENLIAYAQDLQCVGIATWAPRHHASHYTLMKIGFVHQGPITYFTVKPLDPTYANMVKCFSRWWITMGDSDIY